MLVRHHALLSIVGGIGAYPFLGKEIIIPWTTSILLDFDHFLWYFIKFKQFNLKKAIKFFADGVERSALCIFHLIEFWLLLGIFSFFSHTLMLIFIGLSFHLLVDFLSDMKDAHFRLKAKKGMHLFSPIDYLKDQENAGRKISLIRYLYLKNKKRI